MKNKLILIVFAVIAVFLANIACFFYLPHTRLAFDWDFESYSLVLRSILLHFHRFPIHDPWVAGGFDIIANPQSRALAPSLILELFFDPSYVNLSIIIFWGILGFWGFYKLLKFYNVSERSSLIFSTIFLCSSYFGLHLSEGHISFASFQALGLVFFLILNIDRIKYLFFYALLMLLILLEGHIHVFIFSQIILLICLLANVNNVVEKIVKNYKSYIPNFLVICGFSAMIAAAKIIPALLLFAKRPPILDYENMSLYLVLRTLFDPFQYITKDTHFFIHPVFDPKARFHEYGCYIGLVSFFILLRYIAKRDFFRDNIKTILLMIVFFWIGSGWLEVINPWKLFAKIPLLNNVHVASRLFIVMAMFVLILLAKIFDGWRDKPLKYWGLAAFLLIEAVFVRNYPFYKAFDMLEQRPHLKQLITNDNIDQTVYYGKIPYHYYRHNTGSETTYDPAKIYTPIHNIYDINYRGEIYTCDKTAETGTARIEKYIPGEIHLSYDLKEPSCLQLNTNNLLGWKVKSGNVDITSSGKEELLTLSTKDGKGSAILIYRPFYLKFIIPLLLAGLISAFLYWRFVVNKVPLSLEGRGPGRG